jgi:hypothetical protein
MRFLISITNNSNVSILESTNFLDIKDYLKENNIEYKVNDNMPGWYDPDKKWFEFEIDLPITEIGSVDLTSLGIRSGNLLGSQATIFIQISEILPDGSLRAYRRQECLI